jgi:hypothetical protein
MSDDWKPRDRALCIKRCEGDDLSRRLHVGAVYTVTDVAACRCGKCELGLHLAELPLPVPFVWWRSSLFKKLDPHQEDEDDREIIALYTYGPKVGAPV